MNTHFYRNRYKAGAEAGTSFIDIIVGLAIMALIFWGIVGAFLLAIQLISNTKAKTGALSLATEQVEFLRSLSYDDVGTIGGIPSGNIAQTEVINLNGITYTRRVFIKFVDSPEDGLGALDSNGITADYKLAKVGLSWDIRGRTHSLALVSTIVSKGIESIAGGGTLIIKVIDALGVPVSGASVRVVNSLAVPSIDVTTFSNADGQVIFPGSPEANSYKVTVTKSGYSSAQTYDADAVNVAPSPANLSIFVGQVTQITFAIDLVSDKTVKTYEWLTDNSHYDEFLNGFQMETFNNAEIINGDVALMLDSNGDYYSAGDAASVAIAPSGLGAWGSFSWTDTAPANTSIAYQVLYESSPGVWGPVPDGALSGNSVGFSASPVDVSGLSIDLYPSLKLKANLSSTDPLLTPLVHDWRLSYKETVPLTNIPFSMKGKKTIGADGANDPIYKYDTVHSTDGTGTIVLNNLEWDTYTISIDGNATGYDIRESCDLPQPRSIFPGVSTTTTLYLVSHTAQYLHVAVLDVNGQAVPNATVNLTNTGFDETQKTSSCGQTFFPGLASASDYTLTVSLTGFNAEILTNVEIIGPTSLAVTLTAQ